MDNGNIDRLYRQLERIETKIDKITDDHGGRIRKLEMDQSESRGGWKMLIGVGSAAGTIGGIISHLVSKAWPS